MVLDENLAPDWKFALIFRQVLDVAVTLRVSGDLRRCPASSAPASTVPQNPQRLAPLFNPARLRSARDVRGLTQAALAERMQFRLSASAISQLEKGDIKPSSHSLAWLADAIELPETYCVKSSPMPDGFFRSLRKAPRGTRRRALGTASMLRDLVDAVERDV